MRQAFLIICLALSVASVIMIELLSAVQLLTPTAVKTAWVVIFLVLVMVARQKNYRPQVLKTNLWASIQNSSLGLKAVFVLVVILAAQRLFTAIFSAPNTWDGLTYHLPRVEHWIQNATVSHYPTHVTRQAYCPPGAEFLILQWRLILGSDYFSNAVQGLAMIGSLVGASLLARQLGASSLGQLMAPVLILCMPVGIVESVSTQNDYVVTFWLVCLLYWLWQLYLKASWQYAFYAGAALGLSLLTKGTAYIYAAVPIGIIVAAVIIKRKQGMWRYLTAVIVVACALNLGTWVRNYQAFGSVSWTNVELVNKNMDAAAFLGSVVHNTALHFSTPWQDINLSMTEGIKHLSIAIGIDLNNSRASFGDYDFVISPLSRGEDDSSNTVFVIVAFLVAVLMMAPFLRNRKALWGYAFVLIGMFLLFCFIVRYQPWNSRFHLPVFILAAALWATVLTETFKRWVILLVALLLWCALPWMFQANEHPWQGAKSIFKTTRMEQYFSQRPSELIRYRLTAQVIQQLGCRDIGLIQGEDTAEYPWWRLLENVRIEHVAVKNPLSGLKYPLKDFEPCAVIDSSGDRSLTKEIGAHRYGRLWFMDTPTGLTAVFGKI